ncbi:MAG: hypothetical protein IT443_00165 [Phycisphaeraceae bacterium]|nr:hypothetical protein [Phycisphaeraceae bacterium]
MLSLTDHEARILALERSYRRGRLGCLVLSAISLLGFALVFAADPSNKEFLAGTSLQVFLWLALAYAAHARLQHIDTLKRIDNSTHQATGTTLNISSDSTATEPNRTIST